MTADTKELFSEIVRAQAYALPANVVSRYKASCGLTFSREMPAGVTMREMFETVTLVDFGTGQPDIPEDILSAILLR